MTVVTPALCLYKCSLTLDHTKVLAAGIYAGLFDGSGDSASFGVRLPDHLFANCQSDGGDICFTSDSAGTTQLAVELVAISTGSKTCEIWVPVSLSISVDAVIYVWYKSKSGTLTQPAASATYGSQAVWGSNYKLVIHGGTPSSLALTDSTANGNNATNHGLTAGAGQIGGAAIGNGSSYGDCGTNSSLYPPSQLTVSAWINPTNVTQNGAICSTWDTAANTDNGFLLFIGQAATNNKFSIVIEQSNNTVKELDSTTTLTAGVNAQLVGTADGSNLNLYKNASVAGTALAYDGTIKTTSVTNCWIGQIAASGGIFRFTGAIGEVRVKNIGDSANRVSTDYAIQSSISFVTVGTPILNPPLINNFFM